jgi:GNAT superfamily N-acetyltransferase
MRILAEIRRAAPVDAQEISRVILRTLHETTARDYPPHVITAVAESFSPERVAEKLKIRKAYIAILDGAVVGTASLEGCVIRSVFVDPTYQGNGIGARLMDVLEGLAREDAVTTLSVPSTITAGPFIVSVALSSYAMNLTGMNEQLSCKRILASRHDRPAVARLEILGASTMSLLHPRKPT